MTRKRKERGAERRALREHAARKRRLRKRALQLGVFGSLGLLIALWAIDRAGPQELAEAEVVQIQQYQHVTQGEGSHFHTRATILIEGVSEAVVERAPDVQRGQRLQVWIRRGRLSGRPYFQELAGGTGAGVLP